MPDNFQLESGQTGRDRIIIWPITLCQTTKKVNSCLAAQLSAIVDVTSRRWQWLISIQPTRLQSFGLMMMMQKPGSIQLTIRSSIIPCSSFLSLLRADSFSSSTHGVMGNRVSLSETMTLGKGQERPLVCTRRVESRKETYEE